MIKVKEGATAHPRHPHLYYVDGVVDGILRTGWGKEAVLTSGVRPQREGGSSFHPLGLAADYRTHFLSDEDAREFAAAVADVLGNDFDVILEGPQSADPAQHSKPPHLHVEYDPDPVS